MTDTCSYCGHTNQADTPNRDRRTLIAVVDEFGSDQVCALCVLPMLSQPGATLVLAGAAVAAAR